MFKNLLLFLFVLALVGCGDETTSPVTSGPPSGPPVFEEGTGTVVLSGRIN